jgi:hypothetical protein
MNVKISKEIFDKLSLFEINRFLFGSRLHQVNSIDSDFDYVIMLDNKILDNFKTEAKYLPNIHSFQFDDIENNTQYVLMTESQFYHNLFSGDGNMIADIVLFNEYFSSKSLFLCSGYKTIKGYLGVAKRDLKLHSNLPKKRFHAIRSLITAEALMDKRLIDLSEYKYYFDNKLSLIVDELYEKERNLRNRLNDMLDNKEIDLYPRFQESDEILQILINTNNIREFKY